MVTATVAAGEAPTFEVVEVDDRASRRAFLALPHRLYRDDPAWVPPLTIQAREQLDPRQPVRTHLDACFFLLLRDGRPVGRISAQLDRLFEERYGERVGYFGSFEAEEDPAVVQALVEAARGWLAERGATRMQGPFDLNINQQVGLLVEGFGTPPYFLMGHARPYYGPLLEQAGLTPVKDMLAYEVSPYFTVPRVMQRMVRRLEGRVALRGIRRDAVVADLDLICDIFNDAWSGNWGFVPFTRDEFRHVGRELTRLLPPDFIQIAEVDGEPAAFIVLVPNVNEAIADLSGRLLPLGWARLLWRLFVRYPDTARVPLMGVRRAHHHTGLGPGLALSLIHTLRGPAQRKGIERVELSWILEDNQGMRSIIESIGGEVTKRYRVFEAPIAAAAREVS